MENVVGNFMEPSVLMVAALSAGVLHTALGPDHYLPFVGVSQAGNWSLKKTTVVTLIAGVLHVGSAALLSLGAVWLGKMLMPETLAWLDGSRGEFAAWLLMGLGAAYLLWGVRHALRSRWNDGHSSEEQNASTLSAPSTLSSSRAASSLVSLGLMIVFVVGPCEALVPLLLLPQVQASAGMMALVTAVFGTATVVTMTALALAGRYGLQSLVRRVPRGVLLANRYAHIAAGAVMMLAGAAIQFLGL